MGEQGGEENDLSLRRMLELTAEAEVDSRKFDGVDLFLFNPHIDPEADDGEILRIADMIAGYG